MLHAALGRRRTRRTRRTTPRTTTTAALLLTLSLTACGGDGDDDGDHQAERAQAVATIADLAVEGGSTAIDLDADTVAALGDVGVRIGGYGTAEVEDGVASFPVTGGSLTVFEAGALPEPAAGQVQHEGSGLTLRSRSTTVVVGNFNLDPTGSVVYGDVVVNGRVAGTSVALLRLDTSTMETPTYNDARLVLGGTELFLSDRAADLLGPAFGTDELSGDTAVGVATITAVIPPAG